MKAAILAVGSELLGTDRLDTNSLRLTKVLDRHGVELRAKSVLGDSEEDIAGELRRLLDRYDVVLVTGGLGPTADDITREATAAALGRGRPFCATAGARRRGSSSPAGAAPPCSSSPACPWSSTT
jgi:molybdenum cofactor synthesis domain-containing protein